VTTIAIVPVGMLEGAKSRLGAVLDAEERHDLARSMARRTIEAAVATPGIDDVFVVTPDDEVRGLALDLGARPLLQRSAGLNRGLREARDEAIAAGAEAVLILPIDLSHVGVDALAALLAVAGGQDGPVVVLVPDRHGRGTNALLLRPPDVIDVRFGGDSRAAHAEAARQAGVPLLEVDGPLALDLDTPDDLVLAQSAHPERAHG
jgi:2-phospho-L-lactate guanylyltransferase